MSENLFQGELVRLADDDPATTADAVYRWNRDTEYYRLLDESMQHLRSLKKIQEDHEKELENDRPYEGYYFSIHTLDDDRYIGFVGIGAISWNRGEGWVGIGIGEREFWGKGYGTDAMRVLLRYAFRELNLHRVSLGAFEYNPRAIRSYEKAGFVYEGRCRGYVRREGRRWDAVFMGILKAEWERAGQAQG